MALRDQPYIPLYTKDFSTDEKLAECSAAATGVFIRLMCLMHKSEKYGTILLKQKHKQNKDICSNFASQIAKNFPYDFATVEASLIELVSEGVLEIVGDFLIQKRMVRDYELSEKRAFAGKKGGENTTKNKQNFAQAKRGANTEYEYGNEYANASASGIKKGTSDLRMEALKNF